MREKAIAASGNVEAAYRVYVEHGGFVRRLLSSLAPSEDVAEDIYHDLFLSLVGKALPEGITNTKGYLYKAVVHSVFTSKRRAITTDSNTKRYSMEFYRRIHESNVNNRSPLDALIEKEDHDRVFERIEAILPETEATAIKRRFGEGDSRTDVARGMGVNPNTVSVYVSLGLKKLRNSLRKSKTEQAR